MVRFGPGLERRQGFLFRIVDIGLEIFALASTVRHAHKLQTEGAEEATQAVALADFFARQQRRHINALFHDLWRNDDARATRVGQDMLAGKHTWLERGITASPYSIDDMRPKPMDVVLRERKEKKQAPTKDELGREELRIA